MTAAPAGAPVTMGAELAEVGAATRLLSGSAPQTVILRGRYAYVADVDGLSVYAVDAGGRIELEHHVSTPGAARDLAFSGSSLYLADGRAGLASFALDPPERPHLLGHSILPGVARRVIGSEQAVAVLHERGALTVVRPGRTPESLSLPGDPRDAAWVGPHLYVADTGDGLLRVELEPGPPHVAFRERAFRWALSLAARGSLLLLGFRDKRVVLLDASRPVPRMLAEVALDHEPTRLDVLGTQVLAAAGDAGATLLELSEPGALKVTTRLPFAVLRAAGMEPSRMLAARGAEGLSMVHMAPEVSIRARVPGLKLDRVAAAEEQVVVWGEDSAGGWVWPFDVLGHAAELSGAPVREAVACGGALCTLDPTGHLCRRPFPGRSAVSPVCTLVPEGAHSLAWQSGASTLWLLDEARGLQGFSLAEGFHRMAMTSRPRSLWHEQLTRLTLEGARAVAIDPVTGLLQVFDLGQAPRRRGSYLLHARPAAVALAGGVALVAEPSAGLQVIDVNNPDLPHELSWVPLQPGPQGIAVWRLDGLHGEARVALAEGEAGVSLWAWDGRGALRLLRRSDTSGLASDVAYGGGSLWVSDSTGVVHIALPEEHP